MRRLTLLLLSLSVICGCTRGADDNDDEIEDRLPHVEAPLDTLNVIETTVDTGSVEIASRANMATPGWNSVDVQGLPDPKALRYTRYTNEAFNYSIAYPDTLLSPADPIGENRGMEFASPNGDVRMLVYAIEASTREDLNAQYRVLLDDPDASVTYRAREENWYIVAGRRGEDIFYEKSLSSDGILKTFRIQYPAARKSYFDAVAAVMSASFED